ncbi:unnamed protein product [Adineta steineri]|uniref:Uncharacterized protein n=1 Tax=Adineta steineri TaxID=433720 RepID=A0A815NPM9_9BILA|nr:unnamed protein product [Adineta steineri]
MLFNRFATVACCAVISITCFCQKDISYKFGNITVKDFDVADSKIVHEDDGAVILYEAGETHFVGNKNDWFSYVFTCTKRIKILNKKALDLANVVIRLYKEDENEEVLSEIKATTFSLNNGNVTSVNMDKTGIFTEQEDKNHLLKKFTLPAVQEGSIIEYTYNHCNIYQEVG